MVIALIVVKVPRSMVRLWLSVASLSQRVLLMLSVAKAALPLVAMDTSTGKRVHAGNAAPPMGVPKAYAPLSLLKVIL